MSAALSESPAPAAVAAILGWRYTYRFVAENRVDIDIQLTFRKEDDTPVVVGASLFAAGDTTPSGVIDAGAGVYDVTLPIRNFRCIPWTPHTVAGGAQKRYLLNLKLTTVPETEWDEPEVLAFLGGTVGFRMLDVHQSLHAGKWPPQPEDSKESSLRARLMETRVKGFNLVLVPIILSDAFYSLCDELGILVAQAVMAGKTPPDEIQRLQKHPSVAFWADGSDDFRDYVTLFEEPGPPFEIAAGVPIHTI